ncbi:uncharacterized protein LOC112589725 isoform X1 [Harpegnathos saltator]|uniref:uncharacterized protein LOC112589725 isoform X1 n=1 Tax=Harpegnathos saltator TaxID=610380 RepID=UPI000DBEDEBC|nr:uncharacterized protein LOC112589725 isoform X1 [Harpegnathos saltator]
MADQIWRLKCLEMLLAGRTGASVPRKGLIKIRDKVGHRGGHRTTDNLLVHGCLLHSYEVKTVFTLWNLYFNSFSVFVSHIIRQIFSEFYKANQQILGIACHKEIL